MSVLVTGGTGFVGANLVRALLAAGYLVRVLVRPESNRRALTGCPVEVVSGDLLDEDSVKRAVAGCRVVFHAAADYRLWVPAPTPRYRTNVDGTRNVLEACARARVERVVYTSSVGALGIPKGGGVGTETTPVNLQVMVGPYKRSKFLAERVAEEYAARGLPVVIVNPSTPVGPWDVKPTPTGQIIVDFLKGRMFGALDTGLNLVHVADVARGHMLAAQKGRVGRNTFSAIGTAPSPRSSRCLRGPAIGFPTRSSGWWLLSWKAWPASPGCPRASRSPGCGWQRSTCISALKRR